MFPVVILAGGLATRLRPITEKIPKALVEINGQPFIDHQLALLAANGITRVVLSVAYLGEMIAEHVGDGSRYGLNVS
jgi:N-acetyl-alpha-D-muramate 1-phosphate uridylyltransferase